MSETPDPRFATPEDLSHVGEKPRATRHNECAAPNSVGTKITKTPTRIGAILRIESVNTHGVTKLIELNLNNDEVEQLAALFEVGSGRTEVFIP